MTGPNAYSYAEKLAQTLTPAHVPYSPWPCNTKVGRWKLLISTIVILHFSSLIKRLHLSK